MLVGGRIADENFTFSLVSLPRHVNHAPWAAPWARIAPAPATVSPPTAWSSMFYLKRACLDVSRSPLASARESSVGLGGHRRTSSGLPWSISSRSTACHLAVCRRGRFNRRSLLAGILAPLSSFFSGQRRRPLSGWRIHLAPSNEPDISLLEQGTAPSHRKSPSFRYFLGDASSTGFVSTGRGRTDGNLRTTTVSSRRPSAFRPTQAGTAGLKPIAEPSARALPDQSRLPHRSSTR